jgi:hypothetical protein
MKPLRVALASIVSCLCAAGLAHAQGAELQKLDIKAVKSLQVFQDREGFKTRVVLVISNDNASQVRLRNTKFRVQLRNELDMGDPIHLGVARKAEIVLDQARNLVTLDVEVGPKNDDSIGRLIQMFNLIGNPENRIGMLLDGEGEAGVKGDRGWIDQTGLKANLQFKPQVQREVLFE